MNYSESRFSLPFVTDKSVPEELFSYEGRNNKIFSVYYNSLINRILLFGEFSMNGFTNYAMVQGASLRPSDRLTINLLYRKYSPGFTGLHSNGPGISSTTANEHGLLGNFVFEAAKHFFVSAGCNITHYQWMKYRCSFPSLAKREEIRLRYLPSDKLTFDFTYSYRYAMLDNQDEDGVAGVEENKTTTFKGQIKYALNEILTLSSRIDYKIADPSDSRGALLLQDLVCRFRKIPLTLWLRYCVFNTDSWDSRLYTYENDLLYSFMIPSLSGEGSRTYIIAKWEIRNFGELRLKYGITSLIDNGNIEDRDELRFQFRIWF
jgi:hypothetical protein